MIDDHMLEESTQKKMRPLSYLEAEKSRFPLNLPYEQTDISNYRVASLLKSKYVLNWMSGHNYRVATLSTLYLTLSEFIIEFLKSIGQF